MAKPTVPEIELMHGSHLACHGCGAAIAMRHLLKGLGPDTVIVIPACCWAVIPGPMPRTNLEVPVVFSAFECAAAVASGIKAGLRRSGRGHVNVVAFAGDGGTADIGLQALSGAAERNEDILYVCYDNEAYMNTGIQRSGATPPGAWTTTTPGPLSKTTAKKDLPRIVAAHGVPYVATANPSYPEDLVRKAQKAASVKGFRYLHILSVCPTGWKHDPAQAIAVGRAATESTVWPLYEIENGVLRVTKTVRNPIPLAEYLDVQGRFSGLDEAAKLRMQENLRAKHDKLLAESNNGAAPAPAVIPPKAAPTR